MLFTQKNQQVIICHEQVRECGVKFSPIENYIPFLPSFKLLAYTISFNFTDEFTSKSLEA